MCLDLGAECKGGGKLPVCTSCLLFFKDFTLIILFKLHNDPTRQMLSILFLQKRKSGLLLSWIELEVSIEEMFLKTKNL